MIKFESESYIEINSKSLNSDLIFLFFSTRIEEENINIWRKISEMAISMPYASFFLFDKTPNGELSFFYQNLDALYNFQNIHISNRSQTEFALDTLSSLFFVGHSWVMQLHDDDNWFGEIIDINTWKSFQVIKPNQGFSIGKDRFNFNKKFPASIQFCFVPSHVYVIFTKFLRDQKGNVPSSSDHILMYLSELLCEFVGIKSFTYLYDSKHWSSRKKSRLELARLSKIEGWREWSGSDISMINRNIDRLISLIYIRNHLSKTTFELELKSNLARMKPSTIRIIFNSVLFFVFRLISNLLWNSPKSYSKVRSKLEFLGFKREFWAANSITSTIKVIDSYNLEVKFPELEHRVHFWLEKLNFLCEYSNINNDCVD